MNYGRKITIYLADATTSGIRHVEIVNWSGQAIYSPRSRFPELSKWDETKKPGIYFLFERQSSDTENRVYIGESENVLNRLNEQDRQKEFWNELVIFTSKDDNLTKSHIKYLESRLKFLATQAERYRVENKNNPPESSLPRADKDTMEEFIDNIRIVLGVLGHKVLEPLRVTPTKDEQINKSTIVGISLTLSSKSIKANGQVTDDGFLLLAGSEVSATFSKHLSLNWQGIRNKWIEEGILIQTGNNYRLEKDSLLSSSSCAASIVTGTQKSGPQSWQDETGKTLKSIEEQLIGETH